MDTNSRSVIRYLLHEKSDVKYAHNLTFSLATYRAHYLHWRWMLALDVELSNMIVIPLDTGLSQYKGKTGRTGAAKSYSS